MTTRERGEAHKELKKLESTLWDSFVVAFVICALVGLVGWGVGAVLALLSLVGHAGAVGLIFALCMRA